jgi:hypothetical protein
MEPAKHCIECGKPLPLEAKHCPNCGADVQEVTPAPPTQEPSPQSVSTGSYRATLTPPRDVPASQPAQSPYGAPGAAPRSPDASALPPNPQTTVAPGIQGTLRARLPKQLGGGFIAILGGVAMLVAQGFFVSKGGWSSLNLLNIGLGLLCLVSGVVSLAVRGWGWVILGALLSCGVFALCALKLYQAVQMIRTVTPAEATAWTLHNGGILWIGGTILGILAFSRALQSLSRRR